VFLWIDNFQSARASTQKALGEHFPQTSGPPSSTKNVNGSRPTNMSSDIPGKKSQLDFRPFGVGVPIVGSKVVP